MLPSYSKRMLSDLVDARPLIRNIGWVLTRRCNAIQLDVAIGRGAADVEIARINMELVWNLPDGAASRAVVVG